jgi:nucleoside 2-deoxyribosyltransferase
MLVYIAGPYRAEGPEAVAANVARARDVSVQLLRKGYHVICPHTMTHEMEHYPGLDDQTFLRNGLEQLRRCDAVVMLQGWRHSEGSTKEYEAAMAWGKQVYEWPEEPTGQEDGPCAQP